MRGNKCLFHENEMKKKKKKEKENNEEFRGVDPMSGGLGEVNKNNNANLRNFRSSFRSCNLGFLHWSTPILLFFFVSSSVLLIFQFPQLFYWNLFFFYFLFIFTHQPTYIFLGGWFTSFLVVQKKERKKQQ